MILEETVFGDHVGIIGTSERSTGSNSPGSGQTITSHTTHTTHTTEPCEPSDEVDLV